MKTEALIEFLVATHFPPIAMKRLWAYGLSIGALGSLGLLLVMLDLLDFSNAVENPYFWLRETFLLILVFVSFGGLYRCGQPGVHLTGLTWSLGVLWGILGIIALLVLFNAPKDMHNDLLWGTSWWICSPMIALLGLPWGLAAIWGLQQLAPTQLGQAGACAGLFSGACGAFVYSLHCPEFSPPFVMLWYSGGILMLTALGAWIGPRLLRW